MATMTIKDIARICNVSISTVSRAINNDPGINEKTRERILAVVREFNYIPNNSARNLKMAETNTVALLIKGINNPFFHAMYPYFQHGLEEEGCQFLLHTVQEDQDETYVAEEIAKEKKLRGMIFLGGMIENPDTALKRIQIPLVLCSVAAGPATGQRSQAASVAIDDVRESFRVTDYLCKKGHRRIAIIAGRRSDYTVGRLRLEGYRQGLQANGIPFDPSLVGYMKDDIPEYSEANGYAVTRELLEAGGDFTAIFAISDRIAMGVYKAIHEAGRRIPEDYSVVGFDGIEMTKYMHPSLTTVIQPVQQMVESSIRLLMRQMRGEGEREQLIYEAELCERDSVRDLTQA